MFIKRQFVLTGLHLIALKNSVFFSYTHIPFWKCHFLTEKKIYKCNLGCRKNSHYHCCCKRTIISRNNFTQHIHKCRLSLNTQVPTLSGSSLVSSTLPALLGHSALPVNTSVSICSDNNGSDPQCGKDGATGTFNVMSPSPLFSAASLTVSITPSDSKEYIMSVNPSHSLCAASFKEQTPRATRITCRFCNLSLNKKNVKSHMQRRHMSANPDLLQMNGISHTHIASGLVFSIFCAVSVFVSFCSGTILPQFIEFSGGCFLGTL